MRQITLPAFSIENGGFYKRALSAREKFYTSTQDNAIARAYNTLFIKRETWPKGFEEIFMTALLDEKEFRNLIALIKELPEKTPEEINHKLNLAMALTLLKSPLSVEPLSELFWSIINNSIVANRDNKIWAACCLTILKDESGLSYLKGLEENMTEEEICWVASLLSMSWNKVPRDYLLDLIKRHGFLK
jgi:hypothetical protein